MASKSDRIHERVSANLKVVIQSKSGAKKSERISNISLGGVFIETDDPLSFGADMQLEFFLPDDKQALRCRGFVIWSTKGKTEAQRGGPAGMGVRLADIAVADMRRLANYIEGQSR